MESGKLTPAEARYWYGEQDEAGNDLEWLRYNVTLTPTQRYQNHQKALASVLRLRESVRIARARKAG